MNDSAHYIAVQGLPFMNQSQTTTTSMEACLRRCLATRGASYEPGTHAVSARIAPDWWI